MIVEAKDLATDLTTTADVCIVGSGAAGAVAACDLAEEGLSVVVVEEGKYYPEDEMRKMKPSQALRHLYRDYGSVAPMGEGDTPAIPILCGKAIGGSSLLTGGVIYRTPERIVDKWREELSLKEISRKALDKVFDDLERELPVMETPAKLRSKSTRLFKKGCEALGYSMRPIKRNMVDCKGCSQCNFYCPHGAKKSVDKQFIPRSRDAGARYYAGFKVTKLRTQSGRITEAMATYRGTDGMRHKLTVRAKLFVMAAGTIHSSALLLANRLADGSGLLGRNLSIHPSFRAYAEFDEPVYGWRGALQSMECNEFTDQGITFNSIFVPPSMTAAGLPSAGAELRRAVSQMKHLAMFGGMVEDEGNGRVRALPGGGPLITYRLGRRTLSQMVETSLLLARIFLAAGAKKIYLSAHSIPPVRSVDDIEKVDRAAVKGKDFESVAFHPLGTARLGSDPKNSVVTEFGQSWDVPNLFVVDGSIVPSSIRVNSQMTVMAMARWCSTYIRENRRVLGLR